MNAHYELVSRSETFPSLCGSLLLHLLSSVKFLIDSRGTLVGSDPGSIKPTASPIRPMLGDCGFEHHPGREAQHELM